MTSRFSAALSAVIDGAAAGSAELRLTTLMSMAAPPGTSGAGPDDLRYSYRTAAATYACLFVRGESNCTDSYHPVSALRQPGRKGKREIHGENRFRNWDRRQGAALDTLADPAAPAPRSQHPGASPASSAVSDSERGGPAAPVGPDRGPRGLTLERALIRR